MWKYLTFLPQTIKKKNNKKKKNIWKKQLDTTHVELIVNKVIEKY